jgi:class 3 adenylate cyclase
MTGLRRLAAILAADVTGYSCLMGADEEAQKLAAGSNDRLPDPFDRSLGPGCG